MPTDGRPLDEGSTRQPDGSLKRGQGRTGAVLPAPTEPAKASKSGDDRMPKIDGYLFDYL